MYGILLQQKLIVNTANDDIFCNQREYIKKERKFMFEETLKKEKKKNRIEDCENS